MSTSFIKGLWHKPPPIFPWILLFHIGIFLYYTIDRMVEFINYELFIEPVILLLYTVAWLFTCNLRRWAALMYIALTTLNLMARFLFTDIPYAENLNVLFPADVLFTFFVMFYFKRFNR